MTFAEAIAWLMVFINCFSFFFFGLDKLLAVRQKRRIPESTLLLIGFLGGAMGELLAMVVFRHKTKHKKFTLLLPLFFVLQVAAVVYFGFLAPI